MQESDRRPAETLGDVLDGARRQRHHRSALLPDERKLRGLLGSSVHGRLISHIYVAHPTCPTGPVTMSGDIVMPLALLTPAEAAT